MSLRIIYLTGGTACGKGTLGNMLAAAFGFHHISMGEVRRDHLESLRNGAPSIRDPLIQQYILGDKVIPQHLLDRYNPVPAVLRYHNHRANGKSGWSGSLARAMVDEEIAKVRSVAALRRPGDAPVTIIMDGYPLTDGDMSNLLVRLYEREFSGLTIAIECPRDVAKRRFLERGRSSPSTEKFEHRMELTDRSLPRFLDQMAARGDVVYSRNDGTMTIDEAYVNLLHKLEYSEAWRQITNRGAGSRSLQKRASQI